MAILEDPKIYLDVRQRDILDTSRLINMVDERLGKRGVTSRCSDQDSIELEINDIHLIKTEFTTGRDRGSGHIRLWKNGARYRHTTTIVAHRKYQRDTFRRFEVYTPFSKKVISFVGNYSLDDMADLIDRIAKKYEIQKQLKLYDLKDIALNL